MNRHWMPILPLCLLLAGCSDKTARQYAEELTKLMDEYAKRVDHLIGEETARYHAEARALDATRDEAALDDLAADRRTLVTKQYLDGLIEGKAEVRVWMNSVLPDYAERDHNATREIYTKLDGAYVAHMRALQPLAADKAKTRVLRSAFASLAVEPKVFDLARELATFGNDLKNNLAFERCMELNAEAGELAAAVDAITKKAAALAAGSPARLSLEETLETTKTELATVLEQRTKTGRYDATAKECKRP